MDNTFFSSHWNNPFYPVHNRQKARGIPVQDARKATSPRVVAVQPFQGTRPAESSKVVTIPVHFVGSKRRSSESESALRIQKVFRGFVVRMSMKKIAAVRKEVHEIEKRISAEETVELILRDSRERLRVSEMLMSLLLRLDSVRGLDPGVRDCRKTVIRKVIALQEALDAIVSGGDTVAAETSNGEAETIAEETVETTETVESSAAERKASDPCFQTQSEHTGLNLVDDDPESIELVTDQIEIPQIDSKPSPEATEKSPQIPHENDRNNAEGERMAAAAAERTESQTDSSANPESPMEGNEEKKEEERQGANEADEAAGARKQKSKEMLERMMEDNERMMEMMAELFERNEIQTRLLSSLSQRVEQLEKAFVCDKLRRKKKRQAVSKAEVLDKSSGVKKSGKR